MTLILEGDGLYDLPVAQNCHAQPGSDAVTLSFRLLADPSREAVVRIAVPNSLALAFAQQIANAALDKA